ncbi:TetR family transcriptional regulator C-terminal domain-containing protein [Nonomuraea sp. NPDC049607]|uniref:TetR family transcriptional regulator C-terminal domain-containing protein n=1 Tax=Nonomuraea sp. NPDC049607 TaxID=3154732 RepID=UPI00343EEEA4
MLGLLREYGVDLVMVADLNQSIYAFRQAVPKKVLSFAATLPQGERLDGNFRSTPAICRITASVRGLTQLDHALGPHRELTVPIRLLPYDKAVRLRVLYAGFHRHMADLIRKDQQVGRIPSDADPEGTALALVALAEGLAAYVLTGVIPAIHAREQVLEAITALNP